ncbi:MAG: hypothetical protein CL920_34080 [Deltaproteobacteria bacterium]|nr:hypothetical protein [Deltaproteobacteria bacterium]MBU53752.1 hypothetical protein [Deltaproteobacteria bacterium]|tara:strand:+ start:8327 stop:9646 length:1320 start_codon:yes stop_codon:yes gene_type:complete
MRTPAFWRLLFLYIRRNTTSLLLSSLGIVVGTGSFVFFVSLGYGVRQIVTQDLLGVLPVNQIEIIPKTYSLGMFRVGGLLGGAKLNDATLERIRSLKGVKHVFGKMNVRVPSYAMIPIPKEFQKRGIARAFYTEMIAQGIDPKAIPKKDLQGNTFEYKEGKPVPILISKRLLNVYNTTLADLRGFPKLTAQAVQAVRFKMIAGRSAFRRRDHKKGARKYPCHVIGVSRRAILIGVTVPLAFARKLNRIYNGKDDPNVFQSAIIVAKDATDMPRLLKKIEKMGFTMETSQIFARKVGESILFITLLLTLISAVILVISAISISHAFFMFVYEHRYQIGLMRAIGATRSNIRNLLVMMGLLVGMLCGLSGFGITYGLIVFLRWALPQWVSLPFAAHKLFFFPMWLPFLALSFAPLFCLLGSFVPAQRAAALDPAQVLHEAR